MMEVQGTKAELLAEVADLKARLEEAEGTLRAIRAGEIDALVISGPQGEQIFTLRSADHPYRVLVETMNEGAATLMSDGTFLYCNSKMASILDRTPDQVVGSSILDMVQEDERSRVAALLIRGLDQPSSLEVCFASPRGTTPAHLSVSSVPIDHLRGICLIATDLTMQKRNEEIVAAEKLTRSILEQAAEAIVVCDDSGKIIRSNEAARRLRNTDLLDRPFDLALPLVLSRQPGRDESELFSIRAVLAGNDFHGVEACLEQDDNRDVNLFVSAGPLRNAQGDVIGAVVTLADITERKSAEAELVKRSEELARSNADLERFAFAASHDLQEPLRMVTTYTQLLSRTYRDKVGEEAEQFVTYVETGALRMRALIKDLLSYSTVIHTQEKNHRHTDMNAIMFVVLGNLHVLIKENGAVVTNDPLPAVTGDETQLVQLLQNLVSNAIKYQRPGTAARIHVSAEMTDTMYQFAVRDNGVGIAEQYRQTVFGLFKRLHGKEIPGSGIGLALCKRIVELHGGKIWVESVPGDGATFRFTLPASPGL